MDQKVRELEVLPIIQLIFLQGALNYRFNYYFHVQEFAPYLAGKDLTSIIGQSTFKVTYKQLNTTKLRNTAHFFYSNNSVFQWRIQDLTKGGAQRSARKARAKKFESHAHFC